jgi:hypothetical protein
MDQGHRCFVDSDCIHSWLQEYISQLRTINNEDLGRKRPDGLAISRHDRRLFLLEFTRASDYDENFVQQVETIKKERYAWVVTLLQKVLPAWEISTLCFTVGIRGSIPQKEFESVLETLGIPTSEWEPVRCEAAKLTFQVMHDMWEARAQALVGRGQAFSDSKGASTPAHPAQGDDSHRSSVLAERTQPPKGSLTAR